MHPMKKTIRWGILGTGRIANSFAEGLSVVDRAELTAVGSRSIERARDFGEKWKIPKAHGSYEEFSEEKEIDAIYIATPHSEHFDNSVLCMRAGKAVLCEKPLAVNAAQGRKMVTVAREQDVAFMEGMWSRFPPGMSKVREIFSSGILGEIRSLQADFGFRAKDRNPEGRLFNPELAGGSLLDIGIYPVSLSSMIFGKPEEIVSTCHKGETGVDEQAAFIFRHKGGALSVLHSSIQAETSQEALVCGTQGQLRILKQCWRPQELLITHSDGREERLSLPFEGNGFNYEAVAFMELIDQGKIESEIMPHQESIEILETMDSIRSQWGLRYPMEDDSMEDC